MREDLGGFERTGKSKKFRFERKKMAKSIEQNLKKENKKHEN